MFRLYRKTICARWHTNYKNSFEKKSQNVKSRVSVLCNNSEKQNHSDGSHKKQHANKQDKRFWDDPHFHLNFVRASLFETAGWLGAVTVCFNYHVKCINNVVQEIENNPSSCLFSNIVHALPRRQIKNERTQVLLSSPSQYTENERTQYAVSVTSHQETQRLNSPVSVPSISAENDIVNLENSDSVSSKTAVQGPEKDEVVKDANILGKNIKVLSEKYSIALENSIGVENINKNDKKAFHSFQNAARHGSTSGFYNLGLCYQLGKGTRVNLNMAAYCYRRAAVKGHGLASFNLAVFFLKGIGGLPVDDKIAKELLAEAAEKNVPEAQLYFGILFLEEKKWSDAVRIFSNLDEKNIPAAQYYLGLCYENGLGVQRNEKLAFECYKKSADQGNEKAIEKLKKNKTNYIDDSLFLSQTDENKTTEGNSLHSSMSVPELGTLVKKSNLNLLKLSMLSYLNLFTPLLIVNNSTQIKDNCYSNEKVPKEYSSTYLTFKTLPSVVMEVKSQL